LGLAERTPRVAKGELCMIISVRCLGVAGLAAALMSANAAAQTPPQPSAPPTPKECVADSGGFKMHGKTPAYVIELENKCEKRIRCKVYANVSTSRDSKRAQTTLTLAPKSKGAKAKQSYAVRIHEMGGVVQVSRNCQFL
jgi:hypothetical protein